MILLIIFETLFSIGVCAWNLFLSQKIIRLKNKINFKLGVSINEAPYFELNSPIFLVRDDSILEATLTGIEFGFRKDLSEKEVYIFNYIDESGNKGFFYTHDKNRINELVFSDIESAIAAFSEKSYKRIGKVQQENIKKLKL